jgi:hypothetical protein
MSNIETEQTTCLSDNGEKARFYHSNSHCTSERCTKIVNEWSIVQLGEHCCGLSSCLDAVNTLTCLPSAAKGYVSFCMWSMLSGCMSLWEALRMPRYVCICVSAYESFGMYVPSPVPNLQRTRQPHVLPSSHMKKNV